MSRTLARKSEVEPIANEPADEQDGRRAEGRPEKSARSEERRPPVQAVSTFFRDLVEEVKKVAWPSRPDTWKASVAVLRIVALSLAILLLADFVSTLFFRLLFPK